MHRRRVLWSFIISAVPVIAGAQTTSQPDRALWRFVDPGAKAIVGIDWARIRGSRMGAWMREELQKAKPATQFPGFELLDDIDRVLISSPGKGVPGLGDDSGNSDDSLILIALQGRFDPTQVRQLLARTGAKPQQYNSFQVWRPQAKQRAQRAQPSDGSVKDMAWVVVDANTFLFGDARSIFAALDRAQFPRSEPPAGALSARAAEMEANYDFWVISAASEITNNDQVAGLLQGGAEWMSDLQGIETGINLHSGLVADFLVRFGSEASAKRVLAELTRIMNMAAKDKNAGQMQTVAKHLKFNQEGTALKASLKLSQQELEKSAQAFEAGRKASARLAGTTASIASRTPVPMTARPQAAPVEPQKPAVIRIEGLDDGPREIPMGNSSH